MYPKWVFFTDRLDERYPPRFLGRQFGLIAEEVYEVLPELALSDGEKIANVDYEKLSVLLLDAVKKQKQELEELKEADKEMRAQIQQLEQRLDELELVQGND